MLEIGHVPYYPDPHTGGYRIDLGFYTQVKEMLSRQEPVPSSALPFVDPPSGLAPCTEGGDLEAHRLAETDSTTQRDDADVLFQKLKWALDNRRVCKLLYRECLRQQNVWLKVLPVRLFYTERVWYVLAGTLPHLNVRPFRLGRIVDLTVTSEVSFLPASSETPPEVGLQ